MSVSAATPGAAPVGADPSLAAARAAPGPMPLVERVRSRVAGRWARLARWEFWPLWAVYAPLLPHLAIEAARSAGRGGVRACLACNPGIALGGLVGESKWAILSMLPREWIVPSALVAPGPAEARARALADAVAEQGWRYPLVLKPDVGERGAGVRLVESERAAADYLRTHETAVLAQVYDPGPHEAGVFYVRMPGAEAGEIFSITEKVFAAVEGDGRSTLRTLIRRHERYRVQARVYLKRLGARAEEVPARGERVPLVMAGNHCQGTMFRDGARLATPALAAAIDGIARATGGRFCFGRFDVRYRDAGQFAAGRGFRIVELNGLMSESTNIYDPAMGYWEAQRVLRRQWSWAYRIGRANVESARLLPAALPAGREAGARTGAAWGMGGPPPGVREIIRAAVARRRAVRDRDSD
jgi:hypothetical protein